MQVNKSDEQAIDKNKYLGMVESHLLSRRVSRTINENKLTSLTLKLKNAFGIKCQS